jgi:hypothetical protein
VHPYFLMRKKPGWVFLMTVLWVVDMALHGTAAVYMRVAEFQKSESEKSSVLGTLNEWLIFSAVLSWLSTTVVGLYYLYFRNRASREGSLWIVLISVFGLVWLSFAVALSESALLVAQYVDNADDAGRARTSLLLCSCAIAVRLSQTFLGHSSIERPKNRDADDCLDCLSG